MNLGQCLPFVLSKIFCPEIGCDVDPFNSVTSYVDGSMIYGSDDVTAQSCCMILPSFGSRASRNWVKSYNFSSFSWFFVKNRTKFDEIWRVFVFSLPTFGSKTALPNPGSQVIIVLALWKKWVKKTLKLRPSFESHHFCFFKIATQFWEQILEKK